jgi:hypothetical protein
MMPMHDPQAFGRRERELRDSAERIRRVADARAAQAHEPERPSAVVRRLPHPVAEEPCVDCEFERERTSA